MHHKISPPLLLVLAAGLFACSLPEKGTAPPETSPVPERCATAMEVIEKNLEAVGGANRIRAVDTMIIRGSFGSALLVSAEETTLYLKKPDKLKQEGDFRITLCNGDRVVYNNGQEKRILKGGNRERVQYRVGYFHNCFSLLKWEPLFPSAELERIRRYGAAEQYVIRFPGAENGRDLRAYIDANTFLIDRLVYRSSQEGAGTIQVVNQLREYKEFDGIRMPTRLVFNLIGWEVGPSHLLIREVEFNPTLAHDLFDSSDIDFGEVVCEGGTLRGEIRGFQDGRLLTNIRQADLEAAGVAFKTWMELEVGETRMKVKVLDNIQQSAGEIKPDEVYLTTYPISGFTRYMLLGWELDVSELIPCRKGDAIILTRMIGDPEPEQDREKGEDPAPVQDRETSDDPAQARNRETSDVQ